MRRAVIYARYSSDKQSDRSIEDLVRLCRERIEADGCLLTQVYSDHAVSGATLLRPGIQSLIDDAARDKFDLLYAEALDRISRDQENAAGFYKRMRFAEVSIITLSEGGITDLHVGLKGTMNALYLNDLAEKTRRGLRGRIEACRSGGGLTYGYDVVNRSTDAGEGGQRSINREEARFVERIFRDYAAGKSPRAIAFELNKDGISGPSGKGWGASTINGNARRGTGILNNELYIGRLVWNRLRYVKDPDSGKRRSRLNPADQWITKEVPDLRIVPQELWDQVKARQLAVKRATRSDREPRKVWERRRPRFLLSGLIKCSNCGGGYTMISRTLYGCANARNKGTCGDRLNIRRDVLEATILDGLKYHLMNPALFKLFCDEFTRSVNRLRSTRAAERTRREAELRGIKSRLRRIVDAIAEGVGATTLKDELLALEERKATLEQELAGWREEAVRLHPNMAEVYRKQVEELAALLQSEENKPEVYEAIRCLVDQIVLSPEQDKLRVDLHGEIAAILRLAQGTPRATLGIRRSN